MGGGMRRLVRTHKVYRFSRDDAPAIAVSPGEALLVETTDSLDGQIDLAQPGLVDIGARGSEVDPNRALPLTGPIAVQGAEPGDVLAAELVEISIAGNAFILPEFGELLAGEGIEEVYGARVVELRRGRILLGGALEWPCRPMVGCLGLAPAGLAADASTPGDYGGNHDCMHYGEGATLYLQVQVPGALVSLGDVHAAMGDGEGAGTGVECEGEVVLRFHLHGQERIPGPILETPSDWMVYGQAPRTDDAIAMARRRALDLLMQRRGIDRGEALTLMAATCHTRVNEFVNPNRSARVEIPKAVADPLLPFLRERTLYSSPMLPS
jgi:amidase